MPLFAYQLMYAEDPCYSFEAFLDDLRPRSKSKPKTKRDKSITFGRYNRIRKLIEDFHATGNLEHLLVASKLKKRLRKPYRVIAEIGDHRYEFSFPPTVAIERIESFTAELRTCSTEEQVQTCFKRFNATINLF